MRNPAWLVVLSLVLTPLAALAREPPPEVQGLVLAAGQPVFHALVQVLAEPDGAPVQEAWTDERGRFTVDMPKHSMVVRAQRTVLDAQGASHRLVVARPVPLVPSVALKLDREEHGTQRNLVPLPILQAWIAASPGPDTAQARLLAQRFAEVRAAPDAAARKALFLQHAQVLRAGQDQWFEAWFEVEHKRLQVAHDPAAMVGLGEQLAELGQTYDLPWMVCDGRLLAAVGHFHAGQMDFAALRADEAVTAQVQETQRETRPGWLQTRRKGLQTALVIASLAHYLARQPQKAAEVREQALALERSLDLPVEAATSLSFLGDCAVMTGGQAQAWYRQAADVAGKAGAVKEQGQALLSLGRQLEGATGLAALQQATEVLEKAGRKLDGAKARSHWGRRLVALGREREAEPVLTPAIETLRGLELSEVRSRELALALGGIGRGQARYATKQWALAHADLREAMALDEAQGTRDALALDLQTLGYCLTELGRHAEARASLLRSAETYLALGKPHVGLGVTVLGEAARTYEEDTAHPDVQAELALYDRAIALAREHQLPREEAEACQFAGFAAFFAGNTERSWLARAVGYLQASARAFAQVDGTKARTMAGTLASVQRFLAQALAESEEPELAIQTFRASIAGADAAGDHADAMSSRDALGMFLFQQGRFTEAIAEWQPYVDWLATPAAHAPPSQATRDLVRRDPSARFLLQPERLRLVALSLLATARWNLGDPTGAFATLEQEVAVARALQDKTAIFDTWREIGMNRALIGDAAGLQRALTELGTLADTPDRQAGVQALGLLATVRLADPAVRQKRLEAALAWLEPRLAGARKLAPEDRSGFAQAWGLLGSLESRTGRPRDGIRHLHIASELTLPVARIGLLAEVARTHRGLGQLQQALDAQRQVLAQRKTLAMFARPSDQILGLLEVIEIQRALGDLQAAQTTLQDAVKLAQTVEQLPRQLVQDHKALGDLWTLLGRGALTSGQLPGAADALDHALHEYEFTGQDERVAEARVLRVLVRLQLRMQRAIAELKQPNADGPAIATRLRQDRAELRRDLLQTLRGAIEARAFEPLLLGVTGLAAPEDAADKLALVTEAQTRALAAGALAVLPYLAFVRATTLQELRRDDEALASYRAAIAALERLRSSLLSDETKVGFLDLHDEAFYGAPLHLLIERGRGGEALELAEQMRGRALLDVLATGEMRRTVGRQGRAELDALIERLHAAAHQDEALEVEDFAGTTVRTDPRTGKPRFVTPLRAEVKLAGGDKAAQVQALLGELDDRRRQLARSDSEVTSLVTAPAPTLAELQGFVKTRGATAVEYDVGATRLTALVLQPDGQVVVRRQEVTRAQVEALVTRARKALGVAVGRGAEAFEAPKPEAQDEAMEAMAALGKLLIEPIADLLPQDPEAPVLIVPHRALFLLPFAALPDRGEPLVARHAVAVLPSLAVLRYTGHKGHAAGNEALVVGNPSMPKFGAAQLPPLPGAELEATEVTGALTTQGMHVQKLTGGQATETAVHAAMAGAQIIHLATHGVVRDDAVGRSFLALAPGAGGDGLLTVDEVFRLKLQARLVTLSACQTGLGRVTGDGVLGLGRAFLYAGTPAVVVSLWSVSDEATAFEMERFYSHLQVGIGTARALRQAMLETRAKWPSVAEWAAFEVMGEPARTGTP
jgi:CHAT domain-containing protein